MKKKEFMKLGIREISMIFQCERDSGMYLRGNKIELFREDCGQQSIIDFTAKITADFDNFTKTIGSVAGSLLCDPTAKDDFVVMCCEDSGVLGDFAFAITGDDHKVKPEYCDVFEDMLFVYELYLEPQYRGCGIGKFIVSNLNEMFNLAYFQGATACGFTTDPIERDKTGSLLCDPDDKNGIRRNKSILKACGCEEIPESDFMILFDKGQHR